MAKSELEKVSAELDKLKGNLDFYKRQIAYTESKIPRLEALLETLKAMPVKPKRVKKAIEFPVRISGNVYLNEQGTFPRRYWGSDYGVDGIVVARRGNKKLVWFKGHTGWNGVGSTRYYGGALCGFGDSQGTEMGFKGNYDEGSLKNSLAINDEAIKEFLGIEFSILDHYKPKTTLVIEEIKL
jgi:hypothetical protein